MNKTITSKQELLEASKAIASTKGLEAISIRSVATQCEVSIGSIYNYFASKDELVIATIESIWKELIQQLVVSQDHVRFVDRVEQLFEGIRSGSSQYPSFFTLHSMSLAKSGKEQGRQAMDGYFDYLKGLLLESLQQDGLVKAGVFDETFEQKAFVDFVFSNIVSLLINQASNCSYLLRLIQKLLY